MKGKKEYEKRESKQKTKEKVKSFFNFILYIQKFMWWGFWYQATESNTTLKGFKTFVLIKFRYLDEIS